MYYFSFMFLKPLHYWQQRCQSLPAVSRSFISIVHCIMGQQCQQQLSIINQHYRLRTCSDLNCVKLRHNVRKYDSQSGIQVFRGLLLHAGIFYYIYFCFYSFRFNLSEFFVSTLLQWKLIKKWYLRHTAVPHLPKNNVPIYSDNPNYSQLFSLERYCIFCGLFTVWKQSEILNHSLKSKYELG